VSGTVVREERERSGLRAEATVHAEAVTPEARRLAGAVAYARLGRRLLAEGAAQEAIAAAQAGLDEAGAVPFDPDVIDDTDMKLSAARDRLADGHPGDAAEVMLDVLDIRTELHARAQGAMVAR
jgi:hypothetical protein